MKRIVLLLAVALCAGSLQAREYHVAKTGSDTNDGSATSPFLTISKAAMVLKTGDTVTVTTTHNAFVTTRAAVLHYFDRTLVEFAERP